MSLKNSAKATMPPIEFVLDGDAELRSIEREIAVAEARDDGKCIWRNFTHAMPGIGGL